MRVYRLSRIGLCSFFVVILAGSVEASQGALDEIEPNAELAALWWPAQQHVWTPIGWKDHLFRFNVLYNGTILARPHVRRSKKHTSKWAGQGMQLTFHVSANGSIPAKAGVKPYQLRSGVDQGIGNQGWVDRPTPVLWTEWPGGNKRHGVVVRQEVFAHTSNGGDVQTGIEPLYAWIRLSVSHVDELQAPEKFYFLIGLEAVHVRMSMSQDENLLARPHMSAYPRELAAKAFVEGAAHGCRLVEPDGRVRLVGVSPRSDTFTFLTDPDDSKRCFLRVALPVRKNAHADILLPMIPGDREDVESELSLGFDDALEQSDAYWAVKPATAAVIETPEKPVNEAIRQNVKFAEIITEKNPETGEYAFLSGSGRYDALWATPTSMLVHMFLDPLGYHQTVEKHIELLRKHQGTIKPPGPSYPLHPGYLASPKTLTSINWLSDHGAILHMVAKHALLTNDQAFIDRWRDAIIKGCEFIRDARATTGHKGVLGTLPPAVSTDRGVPNQSIWNAGWHYRGLCTAVRLLRRLGDPRAETFAAEARDLRQVILSALRKQARKMPRWTDERGDTHPTGPYALVGDEEMIHYPFYLDTGPLFLVWSGLLDADDELARATVAFFREGPHVKLFDPRRDYRQRPILVHEISSVEPCYSWNVYHSWQLGDRRRFLEGMYSLLSGGMSRQTYISCETRHGIFGNVFTVPLLLDLVRLAVADDQIRENELHLLRLVPKAWLKTDYLTRFEHVATEFGPMTIRFKPAADATSLDVVYEPHFHTAPGKVVLHVPPIATLARVVVNGKTFAANPGDAIPVE